VFVSTYVSDRPVSNSFSPPQTAEIIRKRTYETRNIFFFAIRASLYLLCRSRFFRGAYESVHNNVHGYQIGYNITIQVVSVQYSGAGSNYDPGGTVNVVDPTSYWFPISSDHCNEKIIRAPNNY